MIKKCKECGGEVSTKAETCPHCGSRLKAKQMGCGALLGVAVLGIIILAAAGSLMDNGASSPDDASETKTSRELPQEVFGWEVLAQKQMAIALKDADSAKYSDVHAYKLGDQGKKAYVFCGRVNAKNGFGAYAGYRRFIATAGTVSLENSTTNINELWNSLCKPENDVGPIAF